MERKEISQFEYESIKVGCLLADWEKLNEKFQSNEYYSTPINEKIADIDRLKNTHKSVLSQFGLDIVPASFITDEEERIPLETRFKITDIDVFFSKLKMLSDKNLTVDFSNLLKAAAAGLLYEIRKEDYKPEFFAKMENLTAFTEEYHMIDPKNKRKFNQILAPLEKYDVAYKNDYLAEMLYLEDNGLFGTPEDWENDWSPITWHKSGDAKTYRLRWTRVIEILQEVKENPKADRFRQETINDLIAATEKARKKISQELTTNIQDAYLAILMEARKKLKEML